MTTFLDPSELRKTRWQRLVEHKDASSLAAQRRSLFFGLDVNSGTRVDVPLSALARGHCHIQGRTGSGKTASTLLSAALQAIRGYRDENGNWSKKSPVIVFDFKGDQAMFHAVRFAAENDGRQFRFFSTRRGDGYHFFDPFQIVALRQLEPIQVAATFIRALGLDYGLTYGGLYFTDQNVVLLKDALEELQSAGGEMTLQRLADSLDRLARRSANSDARHISLCLNKLAAYPQINLAAHPRMPGSRIDMLRALEQGEVIYIFMEMASEAPVLRHIAGLQLDALVHAAKSILRGGKDVPFTYVFADEFYHIAGKSFGELLSMVRDWGLHFFLANQEPMQLETHDKSLRSVVTSNSSVRQLYTLDDADTRELWKRHSGEKIDLSHSSSTNPYGAISNSQSEFRTWNLSDDTINEASDTLLNSLVYLDTGAPANPGERVKIVQGLYPVFRWQHEEYRRIPLPTVPQHELVSATGQRHTSSPVRDAAHRQAAGKQFSSVEPELQKRMSEVWAAIDAEERAA